MHGLARLFIVIALGAALAGCGMSPFGSKAPTTVPNVPRESSVDPARAIALINEYRVSKGRPPLKNDPRLSAIAAETARKLARRDTLNTKMHTSQGIARRLAAANYSASRGAENLGAGYPTLVMAVDGWKTSAGHRKNLLNRDLTHAGIGLALTDQGVYKSYWVLFLATPDDGAA